MASKSFPLLLRSFGRPTARQAAALRISRAAYSSDVPTPPLLSKLKDDLKAAMRAKDKDRLSVLRAVLTETLNASKTDKPIKTNSQLVTLLKKTAAKSQEAAAQARAAGREDLAEKEEAQQRILEEYVAGAAGRVMEEAELRQLIESTKASLEATGVEGAKLQGLLFKDFLRPGGLLEGVSFDAAKTAQIITDVCKGRKPEEAGKADKATT